eukprot:365098-Chlamydomonas_euryale.AAC.6
MSELWSAGVDHEELIAAGFADAVHQPAWYLGQTYRPLATTKPSQLPSGVSGTDTAKWRQRRSQGGRRPVRCNGLAERQVFACNSWWYSFPAALAGPPWALQARQLKAHDSNAYPNARMHCSMNLCAGTPCPDGIKLKYPFGRQMSLCASCRHKPAGMEDVW